MHLNRIEHEIVIWSSKTWKKEVHFTNSIAARVILFVHYLFFLSKKGKKKENTPTSIN